MYKRILVPVDNSKHSDEAVRLAASVAEGLGSTVVCFHAYAARLHESRFRQMGPALAGRYETRAERQRPRAVHQTLISDGLRIISESYLDHAEEICRARSVSCERRLAEGSNYVEILREIGRDGYDLVAMGALGLGARRRSLIGSVSERVLRRSSIDVLLVRKALSDSRGVMVVTDGSPSSLKAVDAALRLGEASEQPVEVVSVFDPQFHIVAFRSIANVLSEEGAKLFRFREQQKLHEEIIDGGLEKLYRGHLVTAARMAEAAGQQVQTTLLTGKPFQRVLEYADKRKPSLLVGGRFGLHRTEYADLGSTSENLARLARCTVLVVAGEAAPKEERSFPGPRGEQISMNGRPEIPSEDQLAWTPEAQARLRQVPEGVMRELTRQRVEKLARRLGQSTVTLEVLAAKYREWAGGSARAAREMAWTEEALRRIERIPEFVRGMIVQATEAYARQRCIAEISPEILDEARRHWGETGRFHRP